MNLERLIFGKKSEHEKVQLEILNQLPEVNLINKSYKFGAASMLASIHNWLDELEKRKITSLNVSDVRKAFSGWEEDEELGELVNRLKRDK